MSSSQEFAISIKNISKFFEIYEKPSHRLWQMLYHGRKQFYRPFWALQDISFEVKRGECVGIIGRNGAGKSTLLQIITGTLSPSSGTVECKGRVAALLELGSGFNPEFTGRENVYLNASILGLSKEEIDAKYDDIVAFADIGEFINQPVKSYSSGMAVRRCRCPCGRGYLDCRRSAVRRRCLLYAKMYALLTPVHGEKYGSVRQP